MQSAEVKTRTIKIDGMTGYVCVNKVTAALREVNGVKTESVRVGAAKISADQAGCEAAHAAINASGYKAYESDCKDEAAGKQA